ncbi:MULTISPECIES: iron-sulfur cluster assembly scaffold protein [unclassified Mycoplasma]|uniref:iron-sulfur cluster assembly scaffold protein n=1 Tax=unclassified Mycoplasma TaxID=2683645 RepID=UPI00211BEE5E|nr:MULTISPECIES: iron-sulfur cluster assembly scaffold protein [unclassified Mycoplasma]UUM19515.1 iron-sulfur cluster assembly scaffold protein [Mycoplasma sp. 1578d]UUM24435.1 iron-sulfur cluster assembly scaffold protein [Mycoplasma sp. 3686d]
MDFNANKAREIIMQHYLNPNNKNPSDTNGGKIFFSSTCADKLILKTKFENNVLTQASFDGNGCAIFIASTDILLSTLKNKTKLQIEQILSIYKSFIMQETLTKEQISLIEDLWVFFNVKTHLNRTACALLSAENLLK